MARYTTECNKYYNPFCENMAQQMSECLRIKEEFRERIVFELISKDEPDQKQGNCRHLNI